MLVFTITLFSSSSSSTVRLPPFRFLGGRAAPPPPLIRLEEVLQEWQLACQQDLTQFIKNWSFLPPGFQAPPSQNINVLKKILSQQQADLCIPVEADDPQALLSVSLLLLFIFARKLSNLQSA